MLELKDFFLWLQRSVDGLHLQMPMVFKKRKNLSIVLKCTVFLFWIKYFMIVGLVFIFECQRD